MNLDGHCTEPRPKDEYKGQMYDWQFLAQYSDPRASWRLWPGRGEDSKEEAMLADHRSPILLKVSYTLVPPEQSEVSKIVEKVPVLFSA